MAFDPEYVEEVLALLQSREASDALKGRTPVPNWDERIPGLHHIIHIHDEMRMAPETLWLSVNIYHSYLDHPAATPPSFVTAVTSLWIAAKYEELEQPDLLHLLDCSDGPQTTAKQISGEEKEILTALDYRISQLCPANLWLDAFVTLTSTGARTRRLSMILIESTLLDRWFSALKPRELAAIALFVAMKVDGHAWDAEHALPSGFVEEDLRHGAVQLWDLIRSDEYESSPLFLKHNKARRPETTGYLREWAFTNMV
ncbi:hypothetical protein CF326_g878 [Tilletia indica]|nr:hypothetical protein CF326_g878 [Tilletia indica]